jgi:hypothetical protein
LEAVQLTLELMPIHAAHSEQLGISVESCTSDPAGFHIHMSNSRHVPIQSWLNEQKPKYIHDQFRNKGGHEKKRTKAM